MSTQKTSETSDQIRGSVKEALGKLIGDGKVEAEGKTQQKTPTSDAKPKSAPKT